MAQLLTLLLILPAYRLSNALFLEDFEQVNDFQGTEPTFQSESYFSPKAPIVLAHGMGDSCFNPGMMSVQKELEMAFQTNVVCIAIGNDRAEDIETAFTLTMLNQTATFARKILELKTNKINLVGFSQGGLLARAYIQLYAGKKSPNSELSYPKVLNFASFYGPLMGVAALPRCDPSHSMFLSHVCKVLAEVTGDFAYSEFIQNHVAQSNYLRDPMLIPSYLKTDFLPILNFERESELNVSSLASLRSLILVKASRDSVVFPRESEWFGLLRDNSFDKVDSMRQTSFFKNNSFGLKTLADTKRIHFYLTEGDHLQISSTELIKILKNHF